MNVNPNIFKAYDIRGLYPSEIDEGIAYKVAQAYAKFIDPKTVVLGRDVRTSGPALFEALRNGLQDHGVNVIDIGVVSTDMLYFAVAEYGYDGGLQVTASHNPREYNGIKMVRKGAVPISGDSGIMEIRDIVMRGYALRKEQRGTITPKHILPGYIKKVLSVIDASSIRPMTVVANINFGPTAKNLLALADHLPLTFTMLNGEPNGEFPKGPPDPLLIQNRGETIELVKRTGPDLGVAWDSDADRCYFFDETGRFLNGYFTTAVLAAYMLARYPGAKIISDPRLIWATRDIVSENGGTVLLNKCGHSFIKERMIKEDAVFGGENSGHYYFKDFYYLDNGLIPFLLVLEMLSRTQKKLGTIYQPFFDKYFLIEETNYEIRHVDAVLRKVKTRYADGAFSDMDGISVEYPDWRFNIRASNTQPLLRLNLEANTAALMAEKSKEVARILAE